MEVNVKSGNIQEIIDAYMKTMKPIATSSASESNAGIPPLPLPQAAAGPVTDGNNFSELTTLKSVDSQQLVKQKKRKPNPTPCPYCKKVLSRRSSLQPHIIAQHPGKKVPVKIVSNAVVTPIANQHHTSLQTPGSTMIKPVHAKVCYDAFTCNYNLLLFCC